MKPIGRFAPSPSGRMHLGNVFSALLAWLSARSADGELVLRIEDLDPSRCKEEYANQLRADLQWLGLDWDREQTPQSLRTSVYLEQFQKLADRNLLYPCYCSRGELHAASAPHTADGNVIYAGTCRGLSDLERSRKSRIPAWRVIVPEEEITFLDGLQGEYSENLAQECGDFIVRRSDGVYAYQLAVVTDDAEAGVNQIVRGCDLLSSTPRQIWLQRLFDLPTPKYYHVPLLTAPDGRRLSKRERDLDMGALRERKKPEEIMGWLGNLSGLLEKPEKISAQELAGIFSWEKVRKENIVIDDL